MKSTILLNESEIRQQLALDNFASAFDMYYFSSIDSTNRFLKELNTTSKLVICCAEEQTQGRGRFNREWHSPFAENIYFSSRWQLECPLIKLQGLSLIVGLSIIKALESLKLGANFLIKWPNDIICNNKKIAGILIESIASNNAIVVIGIGLNVNCSFAKHSNLRNTACSLKEINKIDYNRNLILARLLRELQKYLQKFIEQGFAPFSTEFNNFDYLKDKEVSVTQLNKCIKGQTQGINHNGSLIIKDTKGEIHTILAGDASLSQA